VEENMPLFCCLFDDVFSFSCFCVWRQTPLSCLLTAVLNRNRIYLGMIDDWLNGSAYYTSI